MRTSIIARLISVLLLSIAMGALVHHAQVERSQKGRDAFLAAQAQRFDRHMAIPDPALVDIFSCVIVLGVSIGIYELIALGLSKILKAADKAESPAPPEFHARK